MDPLFYLVPILGVVGLLFMVVKAAWVNKQDAGTGKMQEIAKAIADGALAFLKAEWRVMGIFVVAVGLLLTWSGTLVENSHWLIGISFVIGAVVSAFAGYLGMNIATKANVRTTQAARKSLKDALKVSFTAGSVMGLGVAGLAVLFLSMLFIWFYNMFVTGPGDSHGMEKALEVLAGFSLGA